MCLWCSLASSLRKQVGHSLGHFVDKTILIGYMLLELGNPTFLVVTSLTQSRQVIAVLMNQEVQVRIVIDGAIELQDVPTVEVPFARADAGPDRLVDPHVLTNRLRHHVREPAGVVECIGRALQKRDVIERHRRAYDLWTLGYQ